MERAYQLSPEHREKLRQVALRRWADPDARAKMIAGRSHPRSREYRDIMRQAMLRPEIREKCRQAGLKASHSALWKEAQRKRFARPEERERMRQMRLRQRPPQKMTGIERLFHDEFKKRRLKFEMHKTMFGRFQPDFVFENGRLIVQVDGDYWHSPKNQKRQDARFNEAAAAEGWNVWRFGGQEIKMHTVACARAVAKFIRSH